MRSKFSSKTVPALHLQWGSTIGTRKCSFLSCCFHPMKCFSRVFPFKVLFHVQIAMHAIAKYCSSVEKPTNIWLNSCYICCPSALFYFSLCDCSQVAIFPSRHLSPCQHGEAHCRQYSCLWAHFWQCFVAELWFSPLLMAFNFSRQPQQKDGPSIMLFLLFYCASWELCVCVCERVCVRASVWGRVCGLPV